MNGYTIPVCRGQTVLTGKQGTSFQSFLKRISRITHYHRNLPSSDILLTSANGLHLFFLFSFYGVQIQALIASIFSPAVPA